MSDGDRRTRRALVTAAAAGGTAGIAAALVSAAPAEAADTLDGFSVDLTGMSTGDGMTLASGGVIRPASLVPSSLLDATGDASAVLKTTTPFITGRLRLRDVFSARDFGAKGAGNDDTTALQTAIEEARAAGQALYIPAGHYGVSARLTDPDDMSNLTIVGAGRATTILEHGITDDAMLTLKGDLDAACTVTAASAAGATHLTVDSTSGLQGGDLLLVRNTALAINGNPTKSRAAWAGEWCRVKSVPSGTELELDGRLTWPYAAGSDIRVADPGRGMDIRDLCIRNPSPGTGETTARGIVATFSVGINLEGLAFEALDANAIHLFTSYDFRVANTDFLDLRDVSGGNNPYSIIASSGSQHGVVVGCKQRHGRHLFTTGPSSNEDEIPTANVLVSSCIATDMVHTAFDTHPGSCWITFADCVVHNCLDHGFQLRGPDQTISNPIVNQADIGILVIDGADRARILGGRLSGCDTGVSIVNSEASSVADVLISNPTQKGVDYSESGSWSGSMTAARLRDTEITGNPSTAAVNYGVWASGFLLRDMLIPDAATKVVGSSMVVIASATEIALPLGVNAFGISGTTEINRITADRSQTGRVVTLTFQSTPLVRNGQNLKLSANFTGSANSTLTLLCTGSLWNEVARSVN